MNDIIDDDEVRARAVNAVFLIAPFVVGLESVMRDDISVDSNMVAVAKNSLIQIVMNMIAVKQNVVRVVKLDSIPTVADFETFDRDPADCLLPTVFGLQLDAPFAFAVENR